MEIKVPKWCHGPSGTLMSRAELPPTRSSLQNSCEKIKIWALFFIFLFSQSADRSSVCVHQNWDPYFQGCSSRWWKSNGNFCVQMGGKVLHSLLGKFHIGSFYMLCYMGSPAFIKCCNAKCFIFYDWSVRLIGHNQSQVSNSCAFWFGCETVGPAWASMADFTGLSLEI